MTVIKKMTYRGDSSEEYSNQYWFTGGAPADSAAWLALLNTVVPAEKTIYPSTVGVVQVYGYDSDADDATAVYSYDGHASPIAGSLTVGAGIECPGDCAVWVRWKTSRLNSKGKPIYLRKYFHPAYLNTSTAVDAILTAQQSALNALGVALTDGSMAGGRKITARGHTDVILSHAASAYVTTRTLKRRGKRPGS
jgi:hypothetical protein